MSKYTAFISYRHLTPDADIAKKLHTMIENYGIPGSVKRKTGMRNMGRVFRDQDELPLSSDLGDDIRRALFDSDWLICICSPQYLESRWCMEGFMPYRDEDPSASKDSRSGSIAVIHNLALGDLKRIALEILDGRELTDAQKKKYFLE